MSLFADPLSSARSVLRRGDDPNRAIRYLQEALTEDAENPEIYIELCGAYLFKIALFSNSITQKNRDSYGSPPIKTRKFSQLSQSEKSEIIELQKILSNFLQKAYEFSKDKKGKAQLFWVHAWIIKLLKDYYVSAILPPNVEKNLNDNELILIDQAITLFPEKSEFWMTKGDFCLRAFPGGTNGYQLERGNYEALRHYQKAITLPGAKLKFIFSLLYKQYKLNNSSEILLKTTNKLLNTERNNLYYILVLAYETIKQNGDPNRYLSLAEGKESYIQPFYQASVYESFLPSWKIIKEEFTAFQSPDFYSLILSKLSFDFYIQLNTRIAYGIFNSKDIPDFDISSKLFIINIIGKLSEALSHSPLSDSFQQDFIRLKRDAVLYFERCGFSRENPITQRLLKL